MNISLFDFANFFLLAFFLSPLVVFQSQYNYTTVSMQVQRQKRQFVIIFLTKIKTYHFY